MGKKRKSDKHLPPRVYFNHKTYFYVDQKNKWHNLGKTLPEAMAVWSKNYTTPKKIITMNDLFNRYFVEIAPLKSEASYKNNLHQVKPLRLVFGEMDPETITPVHIYAYLDKRGETVTTAANREKELLSHVFTMAIRWGVVSQNPCKDVRGLKENKRDRYVEDYELEAIKNVAPFFFKNLIDFAYFSGQRQKDILSLKFSDLTDEGVKIQTSKTNKKLIIKWSPSLRECIENAKKIRKNSHSFFVFCNEKGQRYTTSGFSTMWTKLMNKAIKAGTLKEKFHFHDLRRKNASDTIDIETARKRLSHTTQNMTSVYINGYQKVEPLK